MIGGEEPGSTKLKIKETIDQTPHGWAAGDEKSAVQHRRLHPSGF
jgi:hypothetical protein